MGFALLDYNLSAAAAGASNSDMTAVSDPDFSQRNSHYIFTENYNLLGISLVGASVTRGRFQVPTWNAIGEFNIFNANRSLQPPSNCQVDWYGAYPVPIPLNEEFQVQASNNLGMGTEIENAPFIIVTTDWSMNIPRGRMPILVRCSFTVTPTANVWSGGQNITLSQSLRGGVYAVVGATVQGSNAVAFRIIFPRYKLYQGRKLRPGFLTQNAVGDVVNNQMNPWIFAMGEWGRFHTFELPQIEVLGTAANSTTYQAFLWLVYLGEDVSLLNYGASTI
jgi:hypothetical protein